MDVLLVAAKKAKIRDYTNLLTTAGLNPVVVDIDVFALENEYEMTTADDIGVVALVDIGATTMNINILKAGYTMFQRDIAIGGNRYTSTIQKELHVGYDQAEALKLGVGVTISVIKKTSCPSWLGSVKKWPRRFSARSSFSVPRRRMK
jgi:type IV pilus assembly protein PilM